MPTYQRKIGDLGEEISCKYLKKHGFKILERNFFRKNKKGLLLGETDIVAKKKKTIHFVEVKTSENKSRTDSLAPRCKSGAPAQGLGTGDFMPERRVNWLKQKKLIKASQIWLIKNKIPSETNWQIDIISVQIDFKARKAIVRHFQNAIY